MQGTGKQDNILKCAQCGAENYLFASFCIACGEPFGEVVDIVPYDDPPGEVATPGKVDEAQRKAGVEEGAVAVALDKPSSTWNRLARRETVIGVLVLALVVGYAIYDWQRSVAESAAYREGTVAERVRDWDKAASYFEQAGGHLDADTKAHNARYQVAERNQMYVDGITAADRKDWKAAAAAFEQVQLIQPAFADSADRLVQARTQAFKLELGGLIYQVEDGPGSGLYIVDDQGHPSLLPGSDKNSAVRAMSPDSTNFVYDRPDNSTLEHARNLGVLFNPADVGRGPMLTTLNNSTMKTRPLPALNSTGNGVFTKDGLWWYSGWYGERQGNGYNQYEIYYSGTQADVVTATAVRLAGPFSSRRVLAFDPSRSRIVLGEAMGDPRTAERKTLLLLASANGQDARPLQTVEGDVMAASVSYDGQWLLLTTQLNANAGKVERAVWLLRTDPAATLPSDSGSSTAWLVPPRKLDLVQWNPSGQSSYLSAWFAPSDKFPVQVLTDRIDGGIEKLTAYSVEEEQAVSIWETAAHGNLQYMDQENNYDTAGFSNSGRYLALRRQDSSAGDLELIDLTRSNRTYTWSTPLSVASDQVTTMRFAHDDTYIIATAQDSGRPIINRGEAIYTAPILPGGGLGDARQIAKADLRSGDSKDLPTVALTPDGSLLAYINARHELHVVFLDGKLDTLIADRVGAVWGLGSNPSLIWPH